MGDFLLPTNDMALPRDLSGPTDRTQFQPLAETQLSLNINLQTLLGCQAVVTAKRPCPPHS